MNEMIRRVLSCCLFLTCFFFGFQKITRAQNAPITTITTVGNAIPNQPVTILVTVTDFDNIGSISLTINYNYSELHYVLGSINPLLGGNYNIGDNDMGDGTHNLIIGWYGLGTTLPDSTWILSLVFTYLTGTPILQWDDDGPSCGYTDEAVNPLNDIPTSTYYINGMVCGALPNPGLITGNNSVCPGTTGVTYSINPIPNTLGYSWSVPPGATITGNSDTNSIIVNYTTPDSSGNISVSGINECGNGAAAVMSVTVALPVANSGNDTIIPYKASAFLHAVSGGIGTFSYHWSPENFLIDPDVQNPQTIQLDSSKLFQLTVTNQNGLCQSIDEINVTVMDSVAGINPFNDESNFQIFPNPVKDYFIIRLSNHITENMQLKIISADGMLVRNYNITISPGSDEYRIESGNLPKSLYFIHINTKNKNSNQKLIIL